MFITLMTWILAQIVILVIFWRHPQGSDQGGYMQLAQACYGAGQWYPMPVQVYSRYIWAPGFVNFLILQLRIFGNMDINGVFNLLMNIGIVAEIYYLGRYFFNDMAAKWAVILWCFMYSNVILIASAGTEIPFLFLSLTAFCLCLSKKAKYIILAALLFTIANWIRPLILIFIPSVIIYMLIRRYKVACYLYLLLPVFLFTFLIGAVTKTRIGYFVFQSTTSGMNLIMTANDKAYGGVANFLTNDTTSTAYIKNEDSYTFLQKDSIWKARAIKWIKAHPVKFTKLYIKKLGGLYIEDSWADRPLLGGDALVGAYVINHEISSERIAKEAILRGIKSLVYYIVLIAFIYSIIVSRKELIDRKVLISDKGIILLILIMGTLITCVFAVSPRYHYPFAFVLVLFAGYGIDTWFKKNNELIDDKN